MYRLIVIIVSSILIGIAFNMFLIPHRVLSGGITGVAMIIGILTPFVNTGIMIFLLNVPILVIGYIYLGKKFIAYSVLSVVVISVSMQFIPVQPISVEPILSAIFGGVIVGIGTGLIFRFSGSTGGFDVIGLLLTRKKDIPVGSFIFVLNAIIVFFSGFIFSWDLALLTMASIFATGKVIDSIYTSNVKLTLMIITTKGEDLKKELLTNLYRGITVLEGEGAYRKEKRELLYTVIARYELADVKSIIKEIDSNAFVNITESIGVVGRFQRKT